MHILNQLENCREYSFPFSLGRIKKIVSLLVYYVCQVKADEEDEYLKNIGTQNERDDFFLACIHRKFVVCRWVTASTPPWYYIRMYWSLSSVCANDIIFSQRIYSTLFALNRPVMLPKESQLVNFALLILIWRDFFCAPKKCQYYFSRSHRFVDRSIFLVKSQSCRSKFSHLTSFIYIDFCFSWYHFKSVFKQTRA